METRVRKNTNISNWFYCDTKNNPADLLTRTKNVEYFQENIFCWRGTQFLSEDTILFNKEETLTNQVKTYSEEFKTSVLFTKIKHENLNVQNVIDVKGHSSFVKTI